MIAVTHQAGRRGIPSLILDGTWKTAGAVSEGVFSPGRLKDRRLAKTQIRSEKPRQPAWEHWAAISRAVRR